MHNTCIHTRTHTHTKGRKELPDAVSESSVDSDNSVNNPAYVHGACAWAQMVLIEQ